MPKQADCMMSITAAGFRLTCLTRKYTLQSKLCGSTFQDQF